VREAAEVDRKTLVLPWVSEVLAVAVTVVLVVAITLAYPVLRTRVAVEEEPGQATRMVVLVVAVLLSFAR
jgi:hypothetical protein